MSSKERLLKAGLELFYRHGIHPVGLDRILIHAGVTKTTFYNYFESKETFVCEVLDVFADQLLKQIDVPLDWQNDEELKARLLGIFNAWDHLQLDKTFRGCLLIAAAVASGDPHDPARERAIRHKHRVFEAIEKLARVANFRNARQFATRFGLILDSSLIARQLNGEPQMATESLQMAEQLIASAISERNSKN
jgi:AcrR family transcriptional regulator